MSDEPTGETTAETEPAPAAPTAPAAAPPERDWEALLNEAPDEIMARHRRVQGIAGSHAERLYQRRAEESRAEQAAKAAADARADLERMAQEKPLEFADMFLSHQEAEKARQQIADMERVTAKKMMEQIGAAYSGLPEWTELSDAEKGRLREAVTGIPDEQVLPRFNAAAMDIIADRRADKRLQDRLPKEQAAWRKQMEAERLVAEGGPDLRGPSSTANRRLNWAAMDDKDFNEWWKKTYG